MIDRKAKNIVLVLLVIVSLLIILPLTLAEHTSGTGWDCWYPAYPIGASESELDNNCIDYAVYAYNPIREGYKLYLSYLNDYGAQAGHCGDECDPCDNQYEYTFADDQCATGFEGPRYLIGKVHTGSEPDFDADAPANGHSDGFCIKDIAEVDWDSAEFCKPSCTGYPAVDSPDDALSFDNGVCCGAKPDESCGRRVGDDFCARLASDEYFHWFDVDDEVGHIIEWICPNVAVLSDGDNFYGCTDEDDFYPYREGVDEINFIVNVTADFNETATTRKPLKYYATNKAQESGFSGDGRTTYTCTITTDAIPLGTYDSMSPDGLFDDAIINATHVYGQWVRRVRCSGIELDDYYIELIPDASPYLRQFSRGLRFYSNEFGFLQGAVPGVHTQDNPLGDGGGLDIDSDFEDNPYLTIAPTSTSCTDDYSDCSVTAYQWSVYSDNPSIQVRFQKHADPTQFSVSTSDGRDDIVAWVDQAPLSTSFSKFTKKQVSQSSVTHDFLCHNSTGDIYVIDECEGRGAAWNSEYGRPHGFSIDSDGQTYYCADNGDEESLETEWTADLDGTNKLSCELGDNIRHTIDNHPDGSKYNAWTGTLCCSEDDDTEEYYNDPAGYELIQSDPLLIAEGTPGGCWNGTYIPDRHDVSNYFDEVEPAKVVSYKGRFVGCELTGSPLLTLEDSQNGGQLIQNMPSCAVLEDGYAGGVHLFCSENQTWKQTFELGQNQPKSIAWPAEPGEIESECCQASQCWNGFECIDDETYSALPETTYGFRCIDGEWTDEFDYKYNWDYSKVGFCMDFTQCLVDPNGEASDNNNPAGNPQCIADNQSIGPYYCDEGFWTTRTKIIALALLKFARENSPDDYTLYCDSYDNVLNYYPYRTPMLQYLVTDYLGYVNKFCVLQYGDQVAFGTSLNEDINSPKSFLRALDKPESICNSAINDNGAFDLCEGSIWYNHDINSVIYLPAGSLDLQKSEWDSLTDTYIRDEIDTIRDWLVGQGVAEETIEYFNTAKLFENLYFARKGAKEVFSFLEKEMTQYYMPLQPKLDFFGINYQGFDVDLCELIRQYDPSIACSSTQSIFTRTRQPGQANIIDKWGDVTAKLRVSSAG